MLEQWYYTQNGERCGPVNWEQLRELAAAGKLKPQGLVWKKGMPDWAPARQMPGLFIVEVSQTPGKPPKGFDLAASASKAAATATETLQSGAKLASQTVTQRAWKPGKHIAAAIERGKPTPTAEAWYYCKGGDRRGPVSTEQLKQLVCSGEVQAADLVWKRGMSQWTEARKTQGLFSSAPASNIQIPPSVAATKPAPPSVPATSPTQTTTSGSGETPALWTPKWLGAWGLLFSWAFGAFLLARNWKALGEPGKAKRAMYWFYAVFPWLLVLFIAPEASLVGKTWQHGWLAILAAFCWIEVQPQMKFVKERFNDQFPHKSWWKPAGIAIGCIAGCMVILVTIAVGIAIVSDASESADVNFVKSACLDAYPNVPVGKAVDTFLEGPQWEAIQGKDGRTYVNARGGVQYQNKPVQATIQFAVDRKAHRFEVNAVEFNNVPQNNLVTIALMNKIFERSSPSVTAHSVIPTRTEAMKLDSEYGRVANGMTKAQVAAILGPGQELSTTELSGVEYASVQYETSKYRVLVSYDNGAVYAKQRFPK